MRTTHLSPERLVMVISVASGGASPFQPTYLRVDDLEPLPDAEAPGFRARSFH